MIHYVTPYRKDRNLGKAYNDTFKLIGDDDWLCITDYDVLALLPTTLSLLEDYADNYPEADMFVCYANRTYPTNQQIYNQVSDNDSIKHHMDIAAELAKQPMSVTRVTQNVSGFLMLIPKRIWNEIKFVEDLKCLGVDTMFSRAMHAANKVIYRMNTVYVFHIYRLEKGLQNKDHLL